MNGRHQYISSFSLYHKIFTLGLGVLGQTSTCYVELKDVKCSIVGVLSALLVMKIQIDLVFTSKRIRHLQVQAKVLELILHCYFYCNPITSTAYSHFSKPPH